MSVPLEGIRILDWTIWLQGPLATSMLGDLGAEVIKIEDRIAGDPIRGAQTLSATQTGLKAGNFAFEALNRNKKSITVNLKKKAGKEIFYKLIEKSDVFVQGFRQPVVKRLGMDYETLHRYNPKLIYVNASGFGPKGPERDEPALDYVVFARSGMMTAIGEADMPPIYVASGTVADHTGAMMTAYSVLAAIVARERLGVGQEVNISTLGSMITLERLQIEAVLALGQPYPRPKRSRAGNPLYNHYCCSDGKWLAVAMLQSDRYWHGFCQALGIQELAGDPKFVDMEGRSTNAEELVRILDKVFGSKPRDEWLRILKKSGDFICGPLNTIPDVIHDPQVLANDYIVDYDHPAHGTIKTVGFPVGLTQTPAGIRLPAPEFGQHTEEILRDILGYSWEYIAKLKDDEVI